MPTEWLIVGLVVLVLFGAKKLPELAKSVGQSFVEFKKAVHEEPKADPAESGSARGAAATPSRGDARTETAPAEADKAPPAGGAS